jgi:hypothetical protein
MPTPGPAWTAGEVVLVALTLPGEQGHSARHEILAHVPLGGLGRLTSRQAHKVPRPEWFGVTWRPRTGALEQLAGRGLGWRRAPGPGGTP